MKRCLLIVLMLVAWTLIYARWCHGQCGPGPGAPGCPGGVCHENPCDYGGWRSSALPIVSPNPQSPVPNPRPAWRYEIPRGHYRSVVRIQTFERDGSRSLGSGVAVRWAGRVVILTARHVVKDARKIWVRGRRGHHEAKLLKTDSTWDVAALEPVGGSDFDTAAIAWRKTGHPKAGQRLESCGLGHNNRLAVNSGRFLGYRTTMRNRRQADWLVLSGHARQGDSGGPVFNEWGELVGVLWGSADGEVIATQCGWLHVFLTQAVGPFRTKSKMVVRERISPTKPWRSQKMVAIQPTGLLGGNRQPVLNPNFRGPLSRLCPSRRPPPEPAPAPQVIVQSDPTLHGKLDQLIVNTTPPPPEEEKAAQEEPTRPLVTFLVIGGAVALGFIVYFASQKGD